MRILFLPHAVRQMSHAERMISPSDVRRAIRRGEVIEDYPGDTRGHSCLIMGEDLSGETIHIVCSPKLDYLAIITAYRPAEEEWSVDFRLRRKL